MAQRAASAPNTVDRALQASLPGWHYFRGTHRQPCHTHNRPTEDMVDRQKREKMHAHKRGGPAIKTATRPRTMNRNSRTSRPRNSRKELEYQGFRLRQVTFHSERSRLPRNSGAPHNGSGDGDMQGSLDLVDLGCRLFPHASFLSLLPQSLTQKPATDAHARPTPPLARTLSQTHSQKREKCMPIKGAAPL